MPEPKPADPPPEASARAAFLEERAFRARTVFVFGTIDPAMALATTRQLLALAAESAAPIDVFVSSPGGHVESGDAIHDIVRFIDAPVTMIGTGWVGSAACHLFLAAPRERRVCLENTRFLIHQPSGGMGGPAADIAIQARELVRARERIAAVIARETGRSVDDVLQDIDRDRWLSAREAIDYGLVSRIVERQPQLRAG